MPSGPPRGGMPPGPGFGPPPPHMGGPPLGYPLPPMAHMGYPRPMWYPPPMPYPPLPNGSHDRYRSHSRSRSRSGGPGRRGGQRKGKGKGEGFKAYHSKNVPKADNLERQTTDDSPATTAMLRNIPNKYKQSELLAEIDEEGFRGQYDFLYLPMDVQNKANVGYAFINFLEVSDRERFCSHYTDRQFVKYVSKKIAACAPAHVNGLEKNVRQLSKKAVAQFKDPEYQPIVFRNGSSIAFSEALGELENGTL